MYGQGPSIGTSGYSQAESHQRMRSSSSAGGGFFQALFDFSFTSFVTPKLVRLAYVLAVVGGGLLGAVGLLAGLARGGATAVAAFIFIPAVFLAWAAYMRIILEILIVVFRIAEPVRDAATSLEELKRLVQRDGPNRMGQPAGTAAEPRRSEPVTADEVSPSVHGGESTGVDTSDPPEATDPTPAPGEAGVSEGNRFCTRCGQENEVANRFCFSCGVSLSPPD